MIVLLVAGIVLLSGCVSKDNSADVVIAGSTTVQPIITKASEVYGEKHPGVRLGVQGGGSGTGIRMVGEGSVAVGASSRELSSEEKINHPDLVTTTVAVDCIAIVVHPSNPLGKLSLTVEQVRDIFSGRITNYKEVGGPDRRIVLVEREDGSGTRSMFEGLVMGKTDVSDAALQKPASGAIRFTVSGNENAIGYVGIGYLDGSIAPVAVNGISPTEENVRSKRYPLRRNLYLVTKGEPIGLAKEFIDFILSDEGQNIVKEEGFIGVK
jgi:phosphate transport system substrate-binding protein